jgi:hypothetical protein
VKSVAVFDDEIFSPEPTGLAAPSPLVEHPTPVAADLGDARGDLPRRLESFERPADHGLAPASKMEEHAVGQRDMPRVAERSLTLRTNGLTHGTTLPARSPSPCTALPPNGDRPARRTRTTVPTTLPKWPLDDKLGASLVPESRPEEASVAESLAGERGVKSPRQDGALEGVRDRISLRGR